MKLDSQVYDFSLSDILISISVPKIFLNVKLRLRTSLLVEFFYSEIESVLIQDIKNLVKLK